MRLVLALLPLAAAVHKKDQRYPAPTFSDSCDVSIPGVWTGFNPQPLGDAYQMNWTTPAAPGAWTVTMISGGGWRVGTGQFSADNTTTTVSFDSGVKLQGNVSDKCSTIVWDNDSIWKVRPPPPPPITDVHVVSMNHLDVGYNGIPEIGLINNIVQRYFDVYYPRAISVAQALTAHGGPERLIYTTHAWLAHMYLHCPANCTLSGITLVCPTPAAVQAFRDAAQRGDITWHAANFNVEYENALNEEMVAVQFQLAFDLADELGLPRPKTVSLRDVPGTTRALVPLLVKNNITAISIGVNGGSPAPDMPNPGIWRDPASGTQVLYMQTGQGIGYPNNPGPDPVNCGGMCRDSSVTFPGITHALVWIFRTDNSGPPMDADEVFRDFDIARWQFPGANVFASTFDNFTAVLAGAAATLPVSTAEVGDTWMTSTTAAPVKMAFYRESARAYAECLAAGLCDIHDPRVLGFTRLLAKLPEHTYGLPGMADASNFRNDQFHAAVAAGEPAYLDALHSYTEQREIATRLGMQYLGNHPLAANISARIAALAPAVPSLAGMTALPAASWATSMALAGGAGITLGFDGVTGAITRLRMAGAEWADSAHALARYVYKTFNDTDYSANPTCCYGERNRQAVANPNRTVTSPTMTGLWVDDAAAPARVVVAMAMPDLQHLAYGAPATLWLTATVRADGALALDLQIFNKTATRLGEAHFFSFLPLPLPAPGARRWLMDKLGSWVDPLDTVRAGSQHQHGVAQGVAYLDPAAPAAYFAIDTLDAAVVSPATAANPPSMFPFPLEPLAGPVLGFDVQLMQNAFNSACARARARGACRIYPSPLFLAPPQPTRRCSPGSRPSGGALRCAPRETQSASWGSFFFF
jgi:hypothetical protein